MSDENILNSENIQDINLDEVTEKKFLDYSMYVIKDRALPDIRDGFKPVHRRILYAMNQLSNYYNRPHKKSARIVGDVIGKYHPHGDSAVYEALVRMAQLFSMRLPLIDGQGNFGSVDGDSAAAMRYTEARQSIFADSMFSDLDKDVIDMVDNYDGTEQIPEVLPVRYPNLLINGTQGIAVGMATYIPTHNPIEVLDCIELILNAKLNDSIVSTEDLMSILPAPDFPTGGLIHGLSEMKNAWESGRCKLKLRAKFHIEDADAGKMFLIITEIPYQVKKELLIEKIGKLATPNRDKGGLIDVEGISSINDETDKDGMRIAIGIKKDFDPEIIFNTLLKITQLETSISYNMTVLIDGEPKVVGMRCILDTFLSFREDVIIKRTQFLDKKAASRSYLLEALDKALENLDSVILLIKGSSSPSVAAIGLMDLLSIEEDQAKFIMEMKLSKLTSSQREDLAFEINELREKREKYSVILNSSEKRIQIMLEENDEQITLFSNTSDENGVLSFGKRQSDFIYPRIDTDLAALTKEESCTISFSNKGYIRRMPISEFGQQNRGTRGKRQMTLSDDDFIQQSISTHSHDSLLIITQKGQVYALNAYEITDVERGRHLNNIIELQDGEKVLMIMPVDFSDESLFLTMMTKNGIIKRTPLDKYSNSFRKSGLIGIEIRDDDELVSAGVCQEGDDIVLINSKNLIIRFSVDTESVRSVSRTSIGVRGMKLDKEVSVIGGAVIANNSTGFLSCITENGMVKITKMDQYRNQKRGGKGVRAFKSSERTGDLFKSLFISDLDSDLITTTRNGVSNRINLANINVTGRNTSGVKLIKIDDKDSIADVFNVEKMILVETELEFIESTDNMTVESTGDPVVE